MVKVRMKPCANNTIESLKMARASVCAAVGGVDRLKNPTWHKSVSSLHPHTEMWALDCLFRGRPSVPPQKSIFSAQQEEKCRGT